MAELISLNVNCFSMCVYLIVVIDELQRESGAGQLHGLQQGSIGRLTGLQRSLTPFGEKNVQSQYR